MQLVVASDAQKHARDVLTHPVWGPPLSVPEYQAREAQLRAHPWARARMTSWLWCEEPGQVLASCETFRMDSVLRGDPGHTYGVASVFTETGLRGAGHATALMQALVIRLVEEDPVAQASILFSDVGPAIYRRAGYVDVVTPYRMISPAPGDPAAAVDGLLSEDAVQAALDRAPWPEAEYLVRPSALVIDWHVERERIYTATLGRPGAPARGARAGDALLLWYANWREPRLEGLLHLGTDPDGLRAVLEAGRRMAAQLGLPVLRLYQSPADPPWPSGEAGGEAVARTDSLPMIAPLREGLSPDAWTWIPRALWI